MATDASYYRFLTNIGNDLADTLESLIDVGKTLPELQCTESWAVFSRIEAELRGCCKDVRNRLARLNDDMDNNLKFLDLARKINQTRNVELLTTLVTIFLPLSLAAGVLSMLPTSYQRNIFSRIAAMYTPRKTHNIILLISGQIHLHSFQAFQSEDNVDTRKP